MNRLRKIPSITQTVLAILFEVGSGTVKSFFPHPYYHTFCSHRHRSSMAPALKRLCDANLIKKSENNIFHLTKEGEKEAFMSYINAEASSFINQEGSTAKWDGRWRIIFFDIPEKKRKYRDYLRILIRNLGFKEFQKSIWIYPYKIPDFLVDILQDENILPHTRFITTESIDFDSDLKKMFNL